MRFTLALMTGLVVPALAGGQGLKQPQLVLNTGTHTATVTQVLFTPDSRRVITVGLDRAVRLWSAKSGELLQTARVPGDANRAGELWAAALSPNGKLLAVGAFGPMAPGKKLHGPIYLLAPPGVDASEPFRLVRVLREHVGTVRALAFSGDGKWLASGGDDKRIRIWDVANGKCVHHLGGHEAAVRDLAFCPTDANRLVSVGGDSTCRLWNVSKQAGTVVYNKATDKFREYQRVAWSPDGKLFAAGGDGNSVHVWHASGKLCKKVEIGRNWRHYWFCPGLSFTSDSRRLLVTAVDDWYTHITFSEIETGRQGREVFNKNHFNEREPDMARGPNAVARNGKLFAVADDPNHHTFVWNIGPKGNPSAPRHLGTTNRRITWVGWAFDKGLKTEGTLLWRTRLMEQDFKEWQPLKPGFFQQQFRIASLALSPVEAKKPGWQRLAVSPVRLQRKGGSYLEVFRDGKKTGVELSLPKLPFLHAYTLLDDQHAVVSTDRGLFLFDVKTGMRIRSFTQHGGIVWAAAPSPVGPNGKRYFATLSDDHVLRVYNPSEPTPLLFLTVSGANWIAWTRGGYYAASPFGERLISWQVNNGPDELPTLYPAAHFHKSLYRPDIIARVLDLGSVQEARRAADKARGVAGQDVSVAAVLPPHVRITVPDRPSLEIKGPALEIKAEAQAVGGQPITAVRLLMDGRPYPGGLNKFPKGRKQVPVAWKVDVPPGTHTFAVVAESAVSKAVTAPIEVANLVRGLKNVNPARPAVKDKPGLYVLAVGISRYPGDLKLDYAHKDALELSKTLARPSTLFKTPEVKVLTDKQATTQGILDGLSWLKTKMKPNDVAIVTFAGHGFRDANGAFFLLSVDAQVADLPRTSVAGDTLKEKLAGISGRIVLLLDACHSGSIGSGARRRGGAADDLVRDLVTEDYGVIVMCSSTGGQYSLESRKHKHGLFTKAVLEGLAGAADYNKDGRVDLKELDLWVTDWVERESQGRQNPVLDGPPYRRFAVAAPGQAPPAKK